MTEHICKNSTNCAITKAQILFNIILSPYILRKVRSFLIPSPGTFIRLPVFYLMFGMPGKASLSFTHLMPLPSERGVLEYDSEWHRYQEAEQLKCESLGEKYRALKNYNIYYIYILNYKNYNI